MKRKQTLPDKTMKVKVHWVIDGIAEVEAESLEDADNNDEERKFGNVSTLDWLQTWRSTEIS